MRGLEGKRVLITGGASGIGAATAARFLEEGSAVVVLDRDSPARERIHHDLPELAGTVDADVSDFKQVQAALDDAVRLMGGVDVLINNAGISIRHSFLRSEEHTSELQSRENLVCRLLLEKKKKMLELKFFDIV